MRAVALLVVVVLVASAFGCAANRVDRRFAAASHPEVVRLFEADTSLHSREDALYHAGVAYSVPGTEVYDSGRALALFDRLLTLYPATRYREHALQSQQLLFQVRSAEAQRAELTRQLDELRASILAQQEQLNALDERLQQEKTRGDALRAITDRLTQDVRAREARIRALEEELTALKEIDLSRPQSGNGRTGAPR